MAKAVLIFGSGKGLVWVGPTVGLNRGSLASPDELGPTEAEVAPAAEGVLRGGTVRVGVPPFHGVDAPAVTDHEAAHLDGLGERRTRGSGEDGIVEREVEVKLLETLAKGVDVLESGDLDVVLAHPGRQPKKVR